MQRYFIQQTSVPQDYQLEPEVFKHAIRVLRLKVGDHFELTDQQQQVAEMELVEINASQARAKRLKTTRPQVELPIAVTIACGLSKNAKPEIIVQKATELGAARIVFFNSAYSIAQWQAGKVPKKLQRLQKIAQAAAEQSHRTQIPTIDFYPQLAAVPFADYNVKLVAYEEAAKQGEKQTLYQVAQKLQQLIELGSNNLLAVFGPEGGISAAEIDFLQQQGCQPAGLGPRILRAETAPWYLLSVLSFVLELG
ncbi:hypothetical protein FC89_GL001652 [Liquorilactobacillus ghanensis DSM 18630]|jgi:16S rRNA (uracil1498-N3)-methyltransferase|uniref:Ribosomal RNA small subunit methyltransferase E n=1 Tax=Liquorilactobacillus ghanensis DSM 18630 TaxID=1423750 RepID=A0A0R1VYW9_9LACO|nr:16S rRNA (uracil(1498)-N(3))-methyltransferase [Liquorilactobacillus ghanensis]KRM08313.1 hypothetical protein FC89_GL001652 [Liquorilactobacillus ghanensis DSM 18630]